MEVQRKGLAVIFSVIIAFIAFSVASGQTAIVDYDVVDTATDWSNAASSSSNVEFTDGFLQLSGTNTSGNYQSNNYDIGANNLTQIVIRADLAANNSANATVQYKNSTGDTQTTEVVELSEGSQDVDLNDSYDQVAVKYDLQRDAGSDTTPKVDYYKVKQESSDTIALFLLKIVAALFALAIMAVVVRS